MKNLGLILAAIALAFAVFSYTSQPKLAYVNSQDVISKYKGAKEANAILKTESEKWRGNVQILKSEVDSLTLIWNKENASWSKKKKTSFAQSAAKKQEELQRYSQAVQQKELQRQQELMNPIFADLNKYIEEYAKANGYDMVFGTMQGNIVYAADATDITKAIIKYVNEQY